MSAFFRKNKTLLHLDLRYNFIEFDYACKLGASLLKNKTLLGLHFEGNAGYIDTN